MFELESAAPETEGLHSSAVLEFLDSLEQKAVPMHGFLALRHGKLIAEGYWKPFDKDYLHRVYSCSKSMTSLAIGYLEAEGKLALSDRIAGYFPEKLPPGEPHPYVQDMTVRDLLMMASPHANAVYKEYPTDDIVRLFFNHPPSHMAGTVFSYDTSATHTLGALAEKLAGVSLFEYLRPRLLDPLGVSAGAFCQKEGTGVSFAGSGVFLTLRDLVKIALACMRGGRLNGTQIIPGAYIRQATSRQISCFVNQTLSQTHMDCEHGYGYQFWCYPGGAFAFLGIGGQVALCFPKEDFLLATFGDTQMTPGDMGVILEAAKDKLLPHMAAENTKPKDGEALSKRLGGLSLVALKGASHSAKIPEIDAKTYMLDDNGLGWREVSLGFSSSGGALYFIKNGEKHSIRFGYGENTAGRFPEHDWDCLASAAWWDDSTLNIACFIVGEQYAPLRMTLYFKGGRVTLYMRNAANRFIRDYNGYACGRQI